jgi:hypoxanthine phosphoribosyltransferase
MNEVRILGKVFRELITEEAIKARVEELALQISKDLAGKDIVVLGILNGAFLFAADLIRHIRADVIITFVKLASYEGTSSSGSVRELIGWNEDIKNKTIVVVEDIVDTGNTMERIIDELLIRKVKEIRIATLLFKPASFIKDFHLDYVGFEIPDDFVIGYGLDYNGYGRNLPSLFMLAGK